MADPSLYQRRRYPTLSLYEGLFDPKRQCMHGYGRYMYPDGSEYRGYFQNGKFHGFGRLRLAPPYKFTFKGNFENGKLVSIEEMGFSDGLSVFAEIKNGKFDVSSWTYCVPEDRRYCNEMNEGLQPVGPNAHITRQRPPRPLPPGNFDAEEGVYKPHSGFLIQCPPPFSPTRFVGCISEALWIIENCRYQFPDNEEETQRSTGLSFIDKIVIRREPNKHFSRVIIDANVASDNTLDDHRAERSIATKLGGNAREFLKNLCLSTDKQKDGDNVCDAVESSSVCSKETGELSPNIDGSTCSYDSFSQRSALNNINDKICVEQNFNVQGSTISIHNRVMKEERSYQIHFGFH